VRAAVQPAINPLTRQQLKNARELKPVLKNVSLDQPVETAPARLQQPVTVGTKIQRHRSSLASVLTSVLVHTILLLVLMLIVFGVNEPEPRISIVAEFNARPVAEQADDVQQNTIEIEIPAETQSPLEMQFDHLENADDQQIAISLNTINNVVAETNQPSETEIKTPTELPQPTLPTGGGLAGRDATARASRAATRGGSEASELAVENGLRWIVEHQQTDGSWRFHHHKGDCAGRCPNEGTRESTTAATGLSLLALMGAGYTHQSGKYQTEVSQGLGYLQERIRYTPHGGILAEGKDGMYAQAIATMALAEAFSMTRDTSLVEPIQATRRYIVKAQHSGGSWGYNAGYPGDTTLTGWQLMALKSCQLAGFPTERTTWQVAESFIDSMRRSDGSFGYRTPDDATITTTAIGLLSKMYLGMHKEHGDLSLGADLMLQTGPSKTDVYFNYYGTQVLHHLQDPDWKIWNEEMRDYLVSTQVHGEGHPDGSWYFPDQHGQVGGRLYTTAMSVMILEVYYRYLPLYEDKAIEAGLDDREENVLR
jgi:hypothetical protein